MLDHPRVQTISGLFIIGCGIAVLVLPSFGFSRDGLLLSFAIALCTGVAIAHSVWMILFHNTMKDVYERSKEIEKLQDETIQDIKDIKRRSEAYKAGYQTYPLHDRPNPRLH